jgi:hypothetical protein
VLWSSEFGCIYFAERKLAVKFTTSNIFNIYVHNYHLQKCQNQKNFLTNPTELVLPTVSYEDRNGPIFSLEYWNSGKVETPKNHLYYEYRVVHKILVIGVFCSGNQITILIRNHLIAQNFGSIQRENFEGENTIKKLSIINSNKCQ